MQKDVPSSRGASTHGPALFFRRLYEQTPWPVFTYLLIAANVVVFGLNLASGMNPFMPSTSDLIHWGANVPALSAGPEPWRLFTSMFLHGGLLHLALNMWVLYQAGPLIERVFGNIGYLVLYVLSGIGGSMASMIYSRAMLSVGASGAIFGIFGGLLAYVMLQRRSMPLPIFRELRSSTISFVLFNVMFGFLMPFIDNAAHIGGLVTGAICGCVLAEPIGRERNGRRSMRALVLVLIGSIVAWLGVHAF